MYKKEKTIEEIIKYSEINEIITNVKEYEKQQEEIKKQKIEENKKMYLNELNNSFLFFNDDNNYNYENNNFKNNNNNNNNNYENNFKNNNNNNKENNFKNNNKFKNNNNNNNENKINEEEIIKEFNLQINKKKKLGLYFNNDNFIDINEFDLNFINSFFNLNFNITDNKINNNENNENNNIIEIKNNNEIKEENFEKLKKYEENNFIKVKEEEEEEEYLNDFIKVEEEEEEENKNKNKNRNNNNNNNNFSVLNESFDNEKNNQNFEDFSNIKENQFILINNTNLLKSFIYLETFDNHEKIKIINIINDLKILSKSIYLKKKGEKGLFFFFYFLNLNKILVKKWKKRYFQIIGEIIYYYENSNTKEIKGFIPINEIINIFNDNNNLFFKIFTVSKSPNFIYRVYEFEAFSFWDKNIWLSFLNDFISNFKKKSLLNFNLLSSNFSSFLNKKGILFKKKKY
jgi:hypothetical protein